MPHDHRTGTRQEWLAARLELLEAEKDLTRRSDDLARRRRELPWVRVEQDYRFIDRGRRRIAGRSVRRPIADARLSLHVRPRTGTKVVRAARRSPTASPEASRTSSTTMSRSWWCRVRRSSELVAYKRRMGWEFRWVSSFGSSFNYDFHVTIDPAVAPVEYNYKDQAQLEADNVAWRDWSGEQPGMSAFAARRRRRVPHVLRLLPRPRRAVDDVAVAGPCAAGPQRRRRVMVPPA